MHDIIAVLGIERLAIIGGLMVLAILITLIACLPTEYVHRITNVFRKRP
jgi:hypothetical protein